jgi:hypothetical protein
LGAAGRRWRASGPDNGGAAGGGRGGVRAGGRAAGGGGDGRGEAADETGRGERGGGRGMQRGEAYRAGGQLEMWTLYWRSRILINGEHVLEIREIVSIVFRM